MNYYNDNDKFCCQWVRNLVGAGLIPKGVVDDRSITDIKPSDLDGFTQCHFFCGIAGWPLALQRANWPAGRPVWTGSCPCQPLSVAGKHLGERDDRHLWPEFFRLIRECRPAAIFGEQTSSKLGAEWMCGVRKDLESIGYAVGCADLPASCVSALHERPRLWWVADSKGIRRENAEYAEGDVLFGTYWGAEKISAAGSLAVDKERFFDEVRSSEFVREANGIPGRVGQIRAYGNAIVPQVAAEFIKAFMEVSDA